MASSSSTQVNTKNNKEKNNPHDISWKNDKKNAARPMTYLVANGSMLFLWEMVKPTVVGLHWRDENLCVQKLLDLGMVVVVVCRQSAG